MEGKINTMAGEASLSELARTSRSKWMKIWRKLGRMEKL